MIMGMNGIGAFVNADFVALRRLIDAGWLLDGRTLELTRAVSHVGLIPEDEMVWVSTLILAGWRWAPTAPTQENTDWKATLVFTDPDAD